MNQIQEEEFVALSRQQANQLIPSLESAYYSLVLKGKYLPKLNSSIITSEYLLGVLFDTFYVPLVEEINIGVLLKLIKKLELIDELVKISINGQKWGIDLKHTPNKEWIVNVLKTLKPYIQVIKGDWIILYEEIYIEQINKIKGLDFSMGRKSNVNRFFKISKENNLNLKNKDNVQEKKHYFKKCREKNPKLRNSIKTLH